MQSSAAIIETELHQEGRLSKVTVGFVAGFSILAASLVNFLNFQSYPYSKAEVLAAFALLALASCVASIIYGASPKVLRKLMEAFLLTLLIDFHFLSELQHALYLMTGLFALLVFIDQPILKPLAIFSGLILLATVAGAFGQSHWVVTKLDGREAVPPASGAKTAAQPAIVHIILDEHIGFGGLPDNAEGRAMQRQLSEAYLAEGFRIYPRAYSEHMRTINAIPAMLDFGNGRPTSADMNGMVLDSAEWFNQIKALGYNLSVYQPEFADYCSANSPTHCVEYAQESLLPMLDIDLHWRGRLQLILSKFIKLSVILQLAHNATYWAVMNVFGLDDLTMSGARIINYTSTISSLQMFEAVTEHASELRPGEALFFHALFPHYPYATREDCSTKQLDDWRMRREVVPMQVKEAAYYEQVFCALRLVKGVLEAVERSPAAGNAYVVVHGDHGSRITQQDPAASQTSLGRDDLRAVFSTLLAIRVPGQTGGIDNSLTTVSAALESAVFKEFKDFPDTPSKAAPTATLDDANWMPAREFGLPDDLFDTITAKRNAEEKP
jgi:hypothetical protein